LAALPAADRGERKDLHAAASQGDLAAVRYFVELKYADVDAQLGDANEAPMHWAARHGHLDVVRYLVTRGADVDIVNKNGQPPLSYALGKHHEGVAEFLMARGADLELRGLFGGMLHSAAGGSNLEAARYLLSLGFDVNEPAREYDIRPLCSAGYSGTPEMIGFLIEQGAEVQGACGRAGRTALHRAADGSNVAGARVLLEHGHDPNGRPGESRTPLHMAVEKGNQEFVKLLLEYDVDPDRKDWDERTALEIARKRQRDEIVLLLQGA
jgi:ankyrin repeat protein